MCQPKTVIDKDALFSSHSFFKGSNDSLLARIKAFNSDVTDY